MKGPIDRFIRPLVSFMNEAGIETVGSCHGHLSDGKEPYIYFKAEVWLAAEISRVLHGELLRAKQTLNFYWVVTGHFNDCGELLFRLSSPSLVKLANSLCHLFTVRHTRRRINADLFRLQEIVQKALLANPHEHNRYRDCSGNDHD